MPDSVNFPRLLAALGLMVSLLAAAQAPLPPMNDAERARRDADKVFSFIKFQTVRSKPAGEPAAKPARAPTPSTERPARAARPAEVATAPGTPAAATAAPAAEPIVAKTTVATTPAGPAGVVAAATVATTAAALPSPAPQGTAMEAAPSSPAPMATTAFAAETEAEPDDHDPDHDDAALQLQNFVAPVLTPALQATLGAGSRNIKVRFTVEASGKVSSAEAAAGVPRRLAKPATDAILQWQFAPLSQARTADVEIAFRRD